MQSRCDYNITAYCLAEMDTFPWYNHWNNPSGKVVQLPIHDEIKADIAITKELATGCGF